MKYLLLLLIFFVSCDTSKEYQRPKPSVTGSELELDTLSPFTQSKVTTYSYEGCEYIVVDFGNSRWGSHKGNCKNPLHKNQ